MKKTIAICASVSFYKEIPEVAKELRQKGFRVLLPDSLRIMQRTGNFDPDYHKTWFTNPEDYKIKRRLINNHFKKIATGDAILVINNEKKGIKGYIGGNVLMEITIAYYLKKQIYLWNQIEKGNPFEEEILALNAKAINKKLELIQ
ncbi:MAG: hypothetical protein AAB553_03940 [Patescibacteria group bacterium]